MRSCPSLLSAIRCPPATSGTQGAVLSPLALMSFSSPHNKAGERRDVTPLERTSFEVLFPRHQDNLGLAEELLGQSSPEWLKEALAAFYGILQLKSRGLSLKRIPAGTQLAEFVRETSLERIEIVTSDSAPQVARKLISYIYDKDPSMRDCIDSDGDLESAKRKGSGRIQEAWALHKLKDPRGAIPRAPGTMDFIIAGLKNNPKLVFFGLVPAPAALIYGSWLLLQYGGITISPMTVISVLGFMTLAPILLLKSIIPTLLIFDGVAAGALREKASMILSSRDLDMETENQLLDMARTTGPKGRDRRVIKALGGAQGAATVDFLADILHESGNPRERRVILDALGSIKARIQKQIDDERRKSDTLEFKLSLVRVPPEILERRRKSADEEPQIMHLKEIRGRIEEALKGDLKSRV